jgi:hypothetical protein
MLQANIARMPINAVLDVLRFVLHSKDPLASEFRALVGLPVIPLLNGACGVAECKSGSSGGSNGGGGGGGKKGKGGGGRNHKHKQGGGGGGGGGAGGGFKDLYYTFTRGELVLQAIPVSEPSLPESSFSRYMGHDFAPRSASWWGSQGLVHTAGAECSMWRSKWCS